MTRNTTLVSGLLFALLIVSSRPAVGQVRVALSAGPTFTTLAGDDAREALGGAMEIGTKTGFFAGASLRVPLGGIVSISPGLYYAQKGTSFESSVGRDIRLQLSYLEVPVTLEVAVTGADLPVGVRLFAGPEIAFEVDCSLEFVSPGFPLQVSYGQFDDCHPPSGVDDSQRKSTDVGLIFGTEVSYGSFLLRGGLDIGLTSLDDSEAELEYRNSAWFLGAGYVIGG